MREILVVQWCWAHNPSVAGTDDAAAGLSSGAGPNEFHPDANRRFNALVAGREDPD